MFTPTVLWYDIKNFPSGGTLHCKTGVCACGGMADMNKYILLMHCTMDCLACNAGSDYIYAHPPVELEVFCLTFAS